MKDPFNLEPRNGDFATYVENLQKAELEKLRRANPAAAEQAAQSIRGGGDSLSLRDLIERSKEVFGAKKAESEKVRETVFGPVTQTLNPFSRKDRQHRWGRGDRRTESVEPAEHLPSSDAMTEEEFDAMVQEGFSKPAPKKQANPGPFLLFVALMLVVGVMNGALPEPLIGFALVVGFAGVVITNAKKRR